MDKKLTAVVLGGGTLKGGTEPKAFLRVDGKCLIDPAVQAVRGCSMIEQRIIVADPLLCRQFGFDQVASIRQPGRSLVVSVRVGASGLDPNEPVLFVCGDLPRVTAAILEEFVGRCCDHPEADAWWGYVSAEAAEQALPGFPHTVGRLADGRFCGAGIALLRPRILRSQELSLLTEERKSILKLLWALGPGTLLHFALGHLTKGGVEAALSRLLACKVVGVESPHGELSVDIDSPRKLALYRRLSSLQRH